jgi:hypothetical protein
MTGFAKDFCDRRELKVGRAAQSEKSVVNRLAA